MADATANHSDPAPTLFISYSSEDREAARRLRDAMSERGIDVWYDEDELTGGDAWDKKIRDRIRACDYFMPLISRSTEARREGYFRREWRQAAERTLDMADDVMFLLPVNIDDVAEYGARVPERFTQVQWSRCPDGQPNPEFNTLCDRILRGDSAHPHLPPSPPVPPRSSQPPIPPEPKKSKGKPLPPYPPQPKRTPDEPAWLHIFNLLVWVVRCVYRAYRGFPRILRWVIIAWAVVFVVERCEGPNKTPPPRLDHLDSTDARETEIPAEVRKVVQEIKGLEKLGGVGRIIGVVADAAQSGRPLALVPFATSSDSPPANALVDTVFAQLLAALRDTRDNQFAISPSSLGANPTISDLVTRTARIESKFLLTGWIEPDPTDQSLQLVVLLHAANAPTSLWTGRFPVAGASAPAIVEAVQQAINAHGVFETALPAAAEVPPAPAP